MTFREHLKEQEISSDDIAGDAIESIRTKGKLIKTEKTPEGKIETYSLYNKIIKLIYDEFGDVRISK